MRPVALGRRAARDPGILPGMLATLLVLAVAVYATGRSADFVDPAALLVVFGGTLTVTATSFGPHELATAVGAAARLAGRISRPDPILLASEFVRIARVARRDGPMVLERLLPSLSGLPIFRRGIELLLEGRDVISLSRVLREEMATREQLWASAEAVFRRAAEVAPAMGLLGTLVGLVRMLATLDTPESIGPGMAVALLTTFYGAVLGHALLEPVAGKISRYAAEERLLARIQAEVVFAIGRRENPRLLAGLLASLLAVPAEALESEAHETES